MNDRKIKRTLQEVVSSATPISRGERIRLAVSLSIPAIVAQISSVVMEYIDAAMVGSLGANPAASIGLVATSTWILFGLTSAASAGFSVQVAHALGSGKEGTARDILRQALVATLIFSIILMGLGVGISGRLPHWLGGTPAINPNASRYFLIFSLSLPILQYNFLAGGMLRCSGDMLYPGMIGVLMCILDVVFNFFLIFPTREIHLFGWTMTMPGSGLGVAGAALGTALATVVATVLLMWRLLFKSPALSLFKSPEKFHIRRSTIRKALHIGAPMGFERFLTNGAQVILTIIVAPLGAASIAANAFAVTAESICYMPGFGISDAATTLVGQSLGAGNKKLARSFAYTCVAMGMIVMSIMGVVLYFGAPAIIGSMSPDADIVRLGSGALRIEAWAEPLYAAAIVCYGVFVGAGDTLLPSFMNLGCMWGVRIILAAILAPIYGLNGVWIAMCVELCCRGSIFLLRLRGKGWMKRFEKIKS